jgi:hypothetical protein
MLESDKSQRRAHELLPRHTQLCLGTLIANNRTCDILADVEGKPGPAHSKMQKDASWSGKKTNLTSAVST